MFDIHMHILYGVDDGATNFEMACEMLDSAYAQGIRGIIATPHDSAFTYSSTIIQARFEQLRSYAQQKYPDLRLALGTELYFDRAFTDYILHMLEKNQLPSMNGRRLILSEFSPYIQQDAMWDIVKKIISAGWIPIIAHAERCPDALDDDVFVQKLLSLGCMIQVNAYSLAGESNQRIRTLAQRLLANQQVHFLGSDAHRMTHRPPKVDKGILYVQEHCTADYAADVLHRNAERLLMKNFS